MAIVRASKLRILEHVARSPVHGYALAEVLNLPVTGIYQHLKELRDEGLVSVVASGRRKVYRITVKGRKLVEALAN